MCENSIKVGIEACRVSINNIWLECFEKKKTDEIANENNEVLRISTACIRRKSVRCYRHCQDILLKSNGLSINAEIELSGKGKASNDYSNLTKKNKQMNWC